MMPTLKTERLVLRPFRRQDAAAVCSLVGNWKVARMLARVPHPYGPELAARWIESHAANWRSGDEITFCVELGGEPIGAVGLRRTGDAGYELGYWLGEPWWGKGLATEAARAAVGFAFDRLGAGKITSGHFIENPASGRVLEKCGFRYTGETTQHCEARGAAMPHRNFECLPDDARDRAKRA